MCLGRHAWWSAAGLHSAVSDRCREHISGAFGIIYSPARWDIKLLVLLVSWHRCDSTLHACLQDLTDSIENKKKEVEETTGVKERKAEKVAQDKKELADTEAQKAENENLHKEAPFRRAMPAAAPLHEALKSGRPAVLAARVSQPSRAGALEGVQGESSLYKVSHRREVANSSAPRSGWHVR